MNVRTFVISLIICSGCVGVAHAQQRTPYLVVEVDRFVAEGRVDFPPDHQISLVEDIIREMHRASKAVDIVREGEPLPEGKAALRIAGMITEFKPGSRTKRYLIGFGAGSTVVKAHVKFIDVASGQVTLDREVRGVTWIGIAGGSSDSAGDRLGKKVAVLAKTNHLIEAKQ